jgi:hypothetical protein
MADLKYGPSKPPLIDDDELKIHKLYRDRIVQEDNLINHRMMWMILSQAFIFGLWGASFKASTSDPIFATLGYVLDVFGCIFALWSHATLAAARGEIDELRKNYLEFYPNDAASETESKASGKFISRKSVRRDILPGLTGSKHFHPTGHIVGRYMPRCLALVWLLLAVLQTAVLWTSLTASVERKPTPTSDLPGVVRQP